MDCGSQVERRVWIAKSLRMTILIETISRESDRATRSWSTGEMVDELGRTSIELLGINSKP
jgi:hypothetical protein